MRVIGLLIYLLLILGNFSYGYNYSWSTHEDIASPIYPNEDPGECDEKEGCKGWSCNRTYSPVYVKTGHLIIKRVDFTLQGKPSLYVERDYSSQEPRAGMFGKGWISNFEIGAVFYVDYNEDNTSIRQNKILLRLPNGLRYIAKTEGNITIDDNGTVTTTGDVTKVILPPGLEGYKIEPLVYTDNKYNKLKNDIVLITPTNTKYIFSKDCGKILKIVDKNGNEINYEYDDNGYLLKIYTLSQELNFEYDDNGFVKRVFDKTGRSWSYEYDDKGNLVAVTNPLGGSREYTYQDYSPYADSEVYSQLTSETDPEGIPVITVTYNGSKVRTYSEGENVYTYSFNGNTAQKTDSVGSVYKAEWNDAGLITKKIDPLNRVTELLYNDKYQLIGYKKPDGSIVRYVKDELGRVVQQIDELNNTTRYEYLNDTNYPVKIISAENRVVSIEYDSHYNPIKITNPKGNIKIFKYDKRGNVVEITDSLGNKTQIAYNEFNLPVSITDALGNTQTIEYDDLGRVIKTTDGEGRGVEYQYDDMDNVLTSTNTFGNRVTYSYDKASRLLSITDPISNITTYTYDNYGRVATITRPDSTITTYYYNKDNTINHIAIYDGKTVTYTYDKAKEIIKENINGESVTFTYDLNGRVTKLQDNISTLEFTYDKGSRIIKELQNGIEVSKTYDKDSYLTSITFNNHTTLIKRDSLGLASQIDDILFAYDPNGILKETIYPNNTKEQYSYNSIYNLINLKTAGINLNYTYDKSSFITSKNDIAYSYDLEGKLIKASNDTFDYDKAGNILNDNAKYDTKTNRLLSNDRYDITYDSSGNIKTKYDKINKTTSYYTFDARNRLIKYEKQDENNNTITLITYEYDPLGRRISKTINNQKEYYIYNENDIIAILDSNKNEKAYITHYDGIDTPLSITTNEGTYYYHRDHQGSILALTDQDGNIVETFTYDNHYGRIIKHTKTKETNNPYIYTGREYDTEELYYYRARYYDPTIQRFISEDPIGFASGDFNFYRYVGDNPVNFRDSLGYETTWANFYNGVKHFIGGFKLIKNKDDTGR